MPCTSIWELAWPQLFETVTLQATLAIESTEQLVFEPVPPQHPPHEYWSGPEPEAFTPTAFVHGEPGRGWQEPPPVMPEIVGGVQVGWPTATLVELVTVAPVSPVAVSR